MTQNERQQRERCWQLLPQVRPSQRIFGIMGLGVLGEDAGHKLVALDFAVAGWSRSRKKNRGNRKLPWPHPDPPLAGR